MWSASQGSAAEGTRNVRFPPLYCCGCGERLGGPCGPSISICPRRVVPPGGQGLGRWCCWGLWTMGQGGWCCMGGGGSLAVVRLWCWEDGWCSTRGSDPHCLTFVVLCYCKVQSLKSTLNSPHGSCVACCCALAQMLTAAAWYRVACLSGYDCRCIRQSMQAAIAGGLAASEHKRSFTIRFIHHFTPPLPLPRCYIIPTRPALG